jgi:hypothetical protein
MDDELRELLRRQADHVPPHRQVPGQMLRRAHRRVAATVIAGAVVVAALAFGSYTGVRALGRPGALQPGGKGSSPTSSPTPTEPSPCTSADLTVAADLQGAAGTRFGSFVFTNRSASTCALKGRPTVTILDAAGKPLVLQVGPDQAWWQVDRLPKPAGWPLVILGPGAQARVRMSWRNWCGNMPPNPTPPVPPHAWVFRLPGHSGQVTLPGWADSPPCNGPATSTLTIGPFEPQA